MAARLLVRGTGCRLPPSVSREYIRTMTQLAHQPEAKRQRVALATTGNASAEAFKQQSAASPAQRAKEAAVGGGGKAKQLVMPAFVHPPAVPEDLSVWQNAVLLVDKPKEWTSFDVCGKLRHSLAALLRKKSREVKVGHAGTLDPMATGLLIVCVGRGTKAVDSFMAMTKEYSGTMRLGEGTPSYDADTAVELRAPWQHITDADLLTARDSFLGQIQQLPPMYSAIKVGGRKLYEAARKGQEVERQPRSVVVERFDLWRDEADAQSVHFRIVCSKGTYIRSLAHDLAQALGSAAHLTQLRREAIGEHRVDGAWHVQQLVQRLHDQRQQSKQQEQQQQLEQQSPHVPEVEPVQAAPS